MNSKVAREIRNKVGVLVFILLFSIAVNACSAPTPAETRIEILPASGNHLKDSQNVSSELLLKEAHVSQGTSDRRYSQPPWSSLTTGVGEGEPIFILSGTIQNNHKKNQEISMYAEGYDATGQKVASTLDAAHLVGVIGLHIKNGETAAFTIHMNLAETLKNIRLFASTYPRTPP